MPTTLDETKLEGSTGIRETLDNKKPGDVVKLLISRNKEEQEIRVTLLADQTGPGGRTMAGTIAFLKLGRSRFINSPSLVWNTRT